MNKCLFQLTIAVFLFGQVAESQAQVFNPIVPQANSQVQQAGGPAANSPGGEVKQAGWGGIPLPKITLPKITMPDMSTVTAPVKSGFSKMKSGTKKAWAGAKEMVSFGQNKSTTAVRRRSPQQKKPSFWSRLITREQEPRVPQTVGEFMSQPRIDP